MREKSSVKQQISLNTNQLFSVFVNICNFIKDLYAILKNTTAENADMKYNSFT